MATTNRTQGGLYINGKQVENSFNNLLKVTNKLRRELQKCSVGTKEFHDKALQLRNVEKQFNRVKQEINSTRSEMNKTGSVFARMAQKLGGMRGMFTMFSSLGDVFYRLKRTTDELMRVSDAMTNVEKTTRIANSEVKSLWASFSDLDTRTSKLDLMKIAEIGGRLGIQGKENIEAFTVAIDKAYVALGDSFEGGLDEVTTKLGKLKNLFSETKGMDYVEAINRIGSALNELAAQGTSSEQNITDFATRIGQLPDALKPVVDKVLGLGAAFEESGEDARIAASGYSRFITKAAENIGAFAYSMNMSKVAAKDLLNSSPEEFFIRFSEGMQGLGATKTANIFTQLKLNTLEIQKSVGVAGKNAGRFRQMMQLSSSSMADASSLSEEFNEKNNNSAAIWTKIWKTIKSIATDSAVYDFFEGVSNFFGWITGVVSTTGNGIKVFRERLGFLVSLLKVATVSFISYKAAVLLTSKATGDLIKRTILYQTIEKVRILQTRTMLGLMALQRAAIALFTKGVSAATVQMRVFNRVTNLNPLGLLLGVLTTVYFAWKSFSSETKKVTKALSDQEIQARVNADVNKAMAESAFKSAAKYKTAVNPLISLLKDQNTTLDMRKRSYDALVKLYPEYNKTVDAEYRATDKLQQVYETLGTRIREVAIARAFQKLRQDAAEKVAIAQVEVFKAKLDKDKEDAYNKEIRKKNKEVEDAYNKSIHITHSWGGSSNRPILSAEKDTASKTLVEKQQKLKEEKKNEKYIEKAQSEKISRYSDNIVKLEGQIQHKKQELSKAKSDVIKGTLQSEILNLQKEKKEAEQALQDYFTGISNGVSDTGDVPQNRLGSVVNKAKQTNRSLSEVHQKSIEAREQANRDAIKSEYNLEEMRIAQIQDGQAKELASVELQVEKKVAAVRQETEKLKEAIGEQQHEINALRERASNPNLTATDQSKIQNSISNLQASIAAKEAMIENNAQREIHIEESKQSQLENIKETWRLKDFEALAQKHKDTIAKEKLNNEKLLLEINSLEKAKAFLKNDAFEKLSSQELNGITSLEDAKLKIREDANKRALTLSLEALQKQKKMLESMLKDIKGEGAEKLTRDLNNLDSKIVQIKGKLQDNGNNESNSDADPDMAQIDVLGFSAEQWDDAFSNLDSMEGKLEATGMVFSALGNIAQEYAQYEKQRGEADIANFTKNQQKKKELLKKQLDSGVISQEEYYNSMKTMEEKLEAKKRAIALRQAKAAKVARIFNIIGDTAMAVAKALPNIPLSIIVGTLGAAQLAVVASQKLPSYHIGGATKGLGFRDASGTEVAGVVHAGEYVVPQWLLRKPEVASVTNWIESKRQGASVHSYAKGGYTTSTTIQDEIDDRWDAKQHGKVDIVLLKTVEELNENLERLSKDGINAFVVGDLQNGRQIEQTVKQFTSSQKITIDEG